jgi:hypothetical protein
MRLAELVHRVSFLTWSFSFDSGAHRHVVQVRPTVRRRGHRHFARRVRWHRRSACAAFAESRDESARAIALTDADADADADTYTDTHSRSNADTFTDSRPNTISFARARRRRELPQPIGPSA